MQPRTHHQSERDWARQWERQRQTSQSRAQTEPRPQSHSRQATADWTHARATQRELETLRGRLEAAERRQKRLLNTVTGLARASGVSVGSPCNRCDRSHLLVTANAIHCPSCGYARSL
ncbi:hypothetical protein [Natronosalvus vescus]|uniref:hypothetical protein n=1 Tax=Natronosalvus vescus TaxID=2953881 RepID=UPI0020910C85|nr:hypothetical protein [Natronosalvus vescus]